MPPKPLPAREVVRRLKRLGFQSVSQRGSHLKLRKSVEGKVHTTIVPMHRKDVVVSVIGRILEQAGIDWDELDSAK